MKCYNIYSAASQSPTYRNIEESIERAISYRSTILIDNEKLYHEIAGDLFLNNVNLDVMLVESGNLYKYENTFTFRPLVLLITSSINNYMFLKQEGAVKGEVYLHISYTNTMEGIYD